MRKIRIFLEKYKFWLLLLAGIGILFNIFVFTSISGLIIFFLIGLWIISIWLYNFEGRVSVAGGLIFLAMCPFLLILKKELIAEKAAIWAYMFLVVGIAQMFIEYLKEERKSAKKEER
ncbi:hypothetical protein KKI19_03150 [Patescibacteria group bacterium]|nr:hypothetical protein [Patescibacteria group bacterium]